MAARPRTSAWWATVAVLAAGLVAWAAGAYSPGGTEPVSGPEALDPISPRAAEVAGFWQAVGDGDVETALAAVDAGAGEPVRHYTAFAAGFEAGFEAEDCRSIGGGRVRCLLRSTNPDLIGLSRAAAPAATRSATVTLTGGGIGALELPEVVNTASVVVYGHARSTGRVPDECDRIHHDALDLPPFHTTMAQTGACAAALQPLIPDALAALGG
jgi:hypothetical protein